MARVNAPFLVFSRGIIDPTALARVDLERTQLSAEVMTNFLPKTVGSMRIRPGTKHFGSSLNDTGANYLPFVAATDQATLIEATHKKVRIWYDTGSAHELSLLGRPSVSTSLSLSDTGWENASIAGSSVVEEESGSSTQEPGSDLIPTMSSATTDGVTMAASGETSGNEAWRAGDDDPDTRWSSSDPQPQWLRVDFGSGNTRTVKDFTIRAPSDSRTALFAPKTFTLQGSANASSWTTEVTVSGEPSWAPGEKRAYTDTGYTDTGANAYRYWRINVTDTGITSFTMVAELELFGVAGDIGGSPSYSSDTGQVLFNAGKLTLNARARGAIARVKKAVVMSDTGNINVEHSLDIHVSRGPVTLRVGQTDSGDDLIRESRLGTGFHSLSFTPVNTPFHVSLQTDEVVNRVVSRCDVGDSGTVEITAPWAAANLDDIRYAQSADVMYVDCRQVRPHKIERRGDGRSWSVVQYEPFAGPFRPFPSSSAKLDISEKYGNTKITSDIPAFTGGMKGMLVRMFHKGQNGKWRLAGVDATTDPIRVTGIADTGTPTSENERRVTFSVSGAWAGTIAIERSFEGEEFGFRNVSPDFVTLAERQGTTRTRDRPRRGFQSTTANIMGGSSATDTGTFSRTIDDPDDNLIVWYRARITSYTSGAAVVTATHGGGGVTGIGKITNFNNSKDVDVEVLRQFSDTGPSSNWQFGFWSDTGGYPTAVELHEGRLAHGGGSNFYLSAADDYENFDEEIEGDAAPIVRTLGSGPVDRVTYLISLFRLIAGTTGSEIAIGSNSFNEPLTPQNSRARTFSTQGSANVPALKIDSYATYVQRSGQKVFLVGFGQTLETLGDFEARDLSVLVPTLLKEGVVSAAIQRQPDTRLHFVLADGTVAILTYERHEEVLCWSKWETDGTVERVAVLPGTNEDAVYYHIRRTINGSTKRFLEKWALETESVGDTGLSYIADCAASYTDTGRVTTADAWGHLVGESVVAWGDDTGQSDAGRDLSPDDTGGDPTLYTVDTGGGIDISSTYSPGVHHLVAGLPFTADWKSSKLAYAARIGTALTQRKRVPHIGMLLYQTHNNALLAGGDTGSLDPLPRLIDEGATVDADKIFDAIDIPAVPMRSKWGPDSRVHIRARAPRPAHVLALVPTIETHEK